MKSYVFYSFLYVLLDLLCEKFTNIKIKQVKT